LKFFFQFVATLSKKDFIKDLAKQNIFFGATGIDSDVALKQFEDVHVEF
jgi:hypothetical protein